MQCALSFCCIVEIIQQEYRLPAQKLQMEDLQWNHDPCAIIEKAEKWRWTP